MSDQHGGTASARPAPVPGTVGPRNNTERELAEIWSALLDDEQPFGVHENFFDLGGDSIKVAEMALMIRTAFGYDLPLSAIFDHATIAGLQLLLRGPAIRDSSEAIVPINRGDLGTPTCCMHPVGGGVARYAALSRALGPEWPMYGLQAIGLNPGCTPHFTILDMAAHYLTEMRRVLPAGPYGILGYSFGGLVAFEVAQQIIQAGGSLAFVALIDTGIGKRYDEVARDAEEFSYRALVEWALKLPYQPGSFRGMRREAALRTIMQQACAAGVLGEESGIELIESILNVVSANQQALLDYRPQPLPGSLLLFTSEAGAADPALGWPDFARDVEVHQVAVGHVAMMDEPAVSRIADVLRTHLRR